MSAYYHDNIPQLAIDLVAQKKLAGKGGTDTPEELGEKLHTLNVQALKARYGDNDMSPTKYDHIPVERSSFHENALNIAVFHRLRCFLYQCSEGDYEENELYTLLKEVSNETAVDIARETKPLYDWGE